MWGFLKGPHKQNAKKIRKGRYISTAQELQEFIFKYDTKWLHLVRKIFVCQNQTSNMSKLLDFFYLLMLGWSIKLRKVGDSTKYGGPREA